MRHTRNDSGESRGAILFNTPPDVVPYLTAGSRHRRSRSTYAPRLAAQSIAVSRACRYAALVSASSTRDCENGMRTARAPQSSMISSNSPNVIFAPARKSPPRGAAYSRPDRLMPRNTTVAPFPAMTIRFAAVDNHGSAFVIMTVARHTVYNVSSGEGVDDGEEDQIEAETGERPATPRRQQASPSDSLSWRIGEVPVRAQFSSEGRNSPACADRGCRREAPQAAARRRGPAGLHLRRACG